MPLKKGTSRRVIAENIRKFMHVYHRVGRISRSRPSTPRKAVKQAAAIAYSMARRSRKGREPKG